MFSLELKGSQKEQAKEQAKDSIKRVETKTEVILQIGGPWGG